jgi:hypothetical protein
MAQWMEHSVGPSNRREKAAQFGVHAPVRFIHDSAGHRRCWRGLTWLVSGMATKVGLCVALYDAAGSTGEGSVA